MDAGTSRKKNVEGDGPGIKRRKGLGVKKGKKKRSVEMPRSREMDAGNLLRIFPEEVICSVP